MRVGGLYSRYRASLRLGLTLDEVKTKLKDAREERFAFLGHAFGTHIDKVNGKKYLSASPSKRSI